MVATDISFFTPARMPFPRLFSKGSIGPLTLKNRLVMPPMVRNYANADGSVTDRYTAHIEAIAAGGVGTMIMEASYVHQDGKGFARQLGIHTDAMIPGLRRLVSAAHAHGAAIGIQLYHGGRQTSAKITGMQPIAPSPLPDPTVNEMPREMTKEDVMRVIRDFAAAARRAKEAGFDMVELHAAHGYLLTQFLSPFSNRRTDKYGGSLENRMRLPLEILSAVRAAVGEDFPIVIRLSGDEMVDGGLTISDTVKIARRLEVEGADALHISVGNYASYVRGRMIPPMAVGDGPLVPLASAVKHAVRIPVIAVAKIRDPKLAESILAEGHADLIAIGRTLLADPAWPCKVEEDRLKEIMPCIACNQGCISRLFDQQDVWCTVNPVTGREEAFATTAKTTKRVLVIGGGPAGMTAAIVAKRRGHEVILVEKTARLGGQLHAASAAPNRDGWREMCKALMADVKRLDIDVRLKKEFTLDDVATFKPDAAIVAIGSTVTIPKIPGIGRTQVVTSRDLLEGKKKPTGKKVVVAGGGCAGAQTAEALAKSGHRVTIVEAGAQLATDAPIDDRSLLLGRLHDLGVQLRTETTMMAIGQRSVKVSGPTGSGMIPADTVVLCLGSYPNDGFTAELKTRVPSVTIVGDALEARRVTDAVEEGARAALAL